MLVDDEVLATKNLKLVIVNNLVPCRFLMDLAILITKAFLMMTAVAIVYSRAHYYR